MTERVHKLRREAPGVTACGQRDGELRPPHITHWLTFRGRVTCPDCLRAEGADPQLSLFDEQVAWQGIAADHRLEGDR